MAQYKYKYYLETPDGTIYDAYSIREIAEHINRSQFTVRAWYINGLPERMIDNGYSIWQEKPKIREYIAVIDGFNYKAETIPELAELTECHIDQIFNYIYDRARMKPGSFIAVIDYMNNQIKEHGKPWRDLTKKDLEGLTSD